ncbi:cuticle protein CP14.6-like [Pollicipes pollicipes]|uniref:cuticle protein CP14.6-like n=1 Tax=Pollicipes pollicipes TaxID=41117 RepID=UPI0018857E70|nr:cuticle protein CP14.6-like [Pollicipes pollicipes]
MMTQTVLLLAAAALVCSAAVLPEDRASTIVRTTDRRATDGGYDFGFETSNGMAVQQSGVIDPATGALSVYGVYEYLDPATGQVFRVQYIADENGFQPQGEHLVRSAGVRSF